MKTISIVDDNRMMREFLKSYLSDDYQVRTFENGPEIMHDLTNADPLPDLILADYQMEDMNGYELLRMLKTSGYYSRIPVIFLSGILQSETRIACLEAGADDFVSKPFNPVELQLKIKKALKA